MHQANIVSKRENITTTLTVNSCYQNGGIPLLSKQQKCRQGWHSRQGFLKEHVSSGVASNLPLPPNK